MLVKLEKTYKQLEVAQIVTFGTAKALTRQMPEIRKLDSLALPNGS